MTQTMLLQLIAAGGTGGCIVGGYKPLMDWLRRTDWGSATALRRDVIESGMDPIVLPIYLAAWRGAALAFLWVAATVMPLRELPILGFSVPVPPVALTGAAILWHACPWWIRGRVERYRRAVTAQVAGAARSLANEVRIGVPLNEAFTEVSRATPAPLGTHLRATAKAIQAGVQPATALFALKRTVRIEAVIAMAAAVQVADQFGGELSHVLDRVAISAEETSRLERKRLADTASGRLMIMLMAIFPAGFLGFMYMMHSGLVAPVFETLIGQAALALAAVLVYGSVRWGSHILGKVG